MRGIRLSHGVAFVEYEGITVKLWPDGRCELSPILLDSLEWDLRTEPPDNWDYLAEGEILALENGGFEKIKERVAQVKDLLSGDEGKKTKTKRKFFRK